MKAINLLFVLCILTFTACSNAEIDNFEDNTSSFESMKSLYGIEYTANEQQISDAPSVSSEEMRGVLEALRKNSSNVQNCKVDNNEGYYGDGSDKKLVMMTAEYQARTRSGEFLEEFALCVSLKFSIDKEAVFYAGTSYSCDSELFTWKGYSASLTTKVDGTSVFGSTTYLYFRVSDQNDCLVKVPVNFNGNYNFSSNQGTYSFSLSMASK